MAHTETTLNSQTIFSGRIIEVKKDDIQLENGKKSIREVVVHHGGVCVAAIDQEDRLLLVRQFRYPYGKELLELPAGKIELGEDPRECGIRELQEECGCTADRFEKLAVSHPCLLHRGHPHLPRKRSARECAEAGRRRISGCAAHSLCAGSADGDERGNLRCQNTNRHPQAPPVASDRRQAISSQP